VAGEAEDASYLQPLAACGLQPSHVLRWLHQEQQMEMKSLKQEALVGSKVAMFFSHSHCNIFCRCLLALQGS
jgi:hypothetical protein